MNGSHQEFQVSSHIAMPEGVVERMDAAWGSVAYIKSVGCLSDLTSQFFQSLIRQSIMPLKSLAQKYEIIRKSRYSSVQKQSIDELRGLVDITC